MFLNEQQPERNLNILVYGHTGTGKTALGVSAPDPLILLSERQGFETVRDHSKRLGIPMPPTFWIEDRTALAKAVHILQTETFPIAAMVNWQITDKDEARRIIAALTYTKPRTVVFDSVTDIMQLVWDGIVEQSPLETAKDGLPTTSMRHWGAMATRGRSFIRLCRDLPYHCLFLALLDDREVDGDHIVQPSLPMRSLPAIMGAACNAVGVARVTAKRKSGEETVMVHAVQFAGPDNMMTKPLRPLRDVEVANMTAWVTALEAEHETNQEEPENV